jgi:hypothetical protein
VVECGGLENRYVGNPGVEGSNPSLSAVGAPLFSFRFLASGSPGCAYKRELLSSVRVLE